MATGPGARQVAGSGIGVLVNEFAQDSVFEQEIKIKRIIDPFAVVWSAGANEIDRSDATHCWVTELGAQDQLQERSSAKDYTPSSVPYQGELDWQDDDFVRVAEYWYAEPVKRHIRTDCVTAKLSI